MQKNSFLSILENIELRKHDTFAHFIHEIDSLHALENLAEREEPFCLFLTAPSDMGVMRNGGRNGARYAPQAIINCLKKFIVHPPSIPLLATMAVTQFKQEKTHYEEAKKNTENLLRKIFTKKSENGKFFKDKIQSLVHIGGGHDQIYPLLAAIMSSHEKVTIINIDAHCDTRQDQWTHSGTPFRELGQSQLSNEHTQLIQYGIEDFSNSPLTLSPPAIKNIEMIRYDEILQKTQYLRKDPLKLLKEKTLIEKDRLYFISLDCDVIAAHSMEAVSSVNPRGLSIEHIHEILHWSATELPGKKYFGLYEYNPLYDNLSQKGAKNIAGLIYQYILSIR